MYNGSHLKRFRTSRPYISVIPPLLAGALVGILSNIFGVGGGYIMVPAMTYLLGMPTGVVLLMSLMQIIFVTTFSTLVMPNPTIGIDQLLATLFLVSVVIGV